MFDYIFFWFGKIFAELIWTVFIFTLFATLLFGGTIWEAIKNFFTSGKKA